MTSLLLEHECSISASLIIVSMSIYSSHFSLDLFLFSFFFPFFFPYFFLLPSSFFLFSFYLLRAVPGSRHAFKRHMICHNRNQGQGLTSMAIMKQFTIYYLDVHLNLYLLSRTQFTSKSFNNNIIVQHFGPYRYKRVKVKNELNLYLLSRTQFTSKSFNNNIIVQHVGPYRYKHVKVSKAISLYK
jgi:hypothetical protein